jgi:GT2 family glycosyltransferase
VNDSRTPLPVAVVVPAYNHAPFLAEAIESVLSQDPPPAELVVVDDGSEDDSFEVARAALERTRGTRTRLVRQENAGAAVAINRGVSMSDAPFVAVLNDDDVYLPGRLAALYATLESTGRELAVSGVEFAGGPGADELPLFAEVNPAGLADIARLPTFGFGLLTFNWVVTSSNLMLTRTLFEELRGFDEDLPLNHDNEILWRAFRLTEPVLVPKILLRYRVHAGNNYRRLRPRLEMETSRALETYASWALGDGPEIRNPLAPCPACWPRFFPAFARAVKASWSPTPFLERLPRALTDPRPRGAIGTSDARRVDDAGETAAIARMFEPRPEILEGVEGFERLARRWIGQPGFDRS